MTTSASEHVILSAAGAKDLLSPRCEGRHSGPWPGIMHRGGCLPPLGSARILLVLPQRRSDMRPLQTLPILLVAALGCQAAPPPDTTAEAKQAIDAANASWARLTAAGHADSLAQYYHPNAVILPPNMPPVHGRDSIRAFFAVLNTMSSPPPV